MNSYSVHFCVYLKAAKDVRKKPLKWIHLWSRDCESRHGFPGKNMMQGLKNSLETILVVEDNPFVMKPVVVMLELAGFKVLSASSARQATQIESDFTGTIHLLLSDVMMPGISGPDLASQLQKRRPQMRVILMSGFAGGAMLVLNHGWHFIQKPFLADALLDRVNDTLHREMHDQISHRSDTRK